MIVIMLFSRVDALAHLKSRVTKKKGRGFGGMVLQILYACIVLFNWNHGSLHHFALCVPIVDTGDGFQGQFDSIDQAQDGSGPMRCKTQVICIFVIRNLFYN